MKIKTFAEIKAERKAPINIVHGTDWWTDCDDIVALRLLTRAHKLGIINLKCVCIDAVMEYSAASVSAFLTGDGLSEIPIGVDFNSKGKGERCRYQRVLAQYPHPVKRNEDCENAVRLYRRVLTECEGRTFITEIGFPQIVSDLLKSQPDDLSPLNGTELVAEKVEKIFMMAGKWDVPNGEEYNLCNREQGRCAGHYICENSPVPVTFLGYEVGDTVISGGGLTDKNDLLCVGMNANGRPDGRSSWDPMLVLLAIIGDAAEAGYKLVRGKASVDPETGRNSFAVNDCGSHAYVVKALADKEYEMAINGNIV